MFLLVIGSYEIDAITVTLITAILTLIGWLVINILNATWLETRRRRIQLETEKTALREALYSEMNFIMVGTIVVIRNAIFKKAESKSWKTLKMMISAKLPLDLDVYHYTRKNPTLFYQLRDAFEIDFFYRNISEVLARIDSKVEEEAEGEDQSEQILSFMQDDVKYKLVTGIVGLELDMLLPLKKESDGLAEAEALLIVNHMCERKKDESQPTKSETQPPE